MQGMCLEHHDKDIKQWLKDGGTGMSFQLFSQSAKGKLEKVNLTFSC